MTVAAQPDEDPIAPRLVRELMLVSVLVAGEGAASLAEALAQDGAAADVLAGTDVPEGYDLAILLADPGSAAEASTRNLVAGLASASERLLFAPLPLGAAAGAGPALPQLTQWFEVFAEYGYQPVVEFDASFVSPGAFLVDRAATAAEGDLSAFADRLQLGPDPAGPAKRGTPPEDAAVAALRADLDTVRASLADSREQIEEARAQAGHLRAQLNQLAAQHTALQAQLHEAAGRNAGWDGLRHWLRATVADPSRDSAAALMRDLKQLNAWRSPAPPYAIAEPGRLTRLWQRLRPVAGPALLADTALVRASPLFDAAWYVASTPELAEAAVDPVFHYVLVGTLRGADPGPWFDTASYVASHPEIAGTAACPLVHAIRSGSAADMPAG